MRKTWMIRAAVAMVASVVGVGSAHTQVFTPTYMSPRLTSDLGIYIGDAVSEPGDLSIEGIWRGGPLGLRVGYSELGSDDGALLLGAELRNPIALVGAPIGLAFTAGAQAALGDDDNEALGFQLGLTAGHTFVSPGIAFTPYIHPRLGIINDFGPGDEFDLEALADVGVDLSFSPNVILRFAANLGDGADWGVGLAWRSR
jgi:hypothetical protein